MSIVVRYAPVPSSTIEQYDEVLRRLQGSGESLRTDLTTVSRFFRPVSYW